jgi:propanol-preferring alcohol dehydrogenase
MRAFRLTQPGPAEGRPLRLVEAPAPVPAADEILLKVRACGICRTDLHVVEGDLPVRRPNVIPGHQIAGEVVGRGAEVTQFAVGDRAGVAWLHRTCGVCRHCAAGRENLCDAPQFTGWTVDGGFADFAVAPAAFAYRLPAALTDEQAAPLMCAGIIGYRALRLTGIASWPGARLGLYGFGAAGHVAIQIARARGAEVYVCTRDQQRHQALARELGAAWVGGAADPPPVPLDAAIVFAPAGELVPAVLRALDKGGACVLGGIHMSPIPEMEYALIYQERSMRSVASNTRQDGREFLEEAARAGVRTHTQAFRFAQANEALIALKRDAIRGAAVLAAD